MVVDRSGRPLGRCGPIEVAEPWWPAVGSVLDAVARLHGPDLPVGAVLRLLRAEPDPDEPMGGRATYAVVCHRPPAPGLLTPLGEDDLALLAPDPLRAPWAEPGGPAADLAWVGEQLGRLGDGVTSTGPPQQRRTWNLSSIWSVPTSEGTVWLKAVPPFMTHEATVLRVLADQPVPRLVAAEGHRLLLGDLPGEDGFQADVAEQIGMVTTLVDIEAAAADRVDELLAGGVTDLRRSGLVAELTGLVDGVAADRAPLRALVDRLDDRLVEAAQWSPPDTVVHGDPHPGNCRRGTEPPVWFDWGDAFVGNPLLDLGATHRMAPAAVTAWFGAMRRAWPGVEPERAWAVLEPVAALLQAWVYQRFLDGIEPTERVYHRDDVDAALAATERLLASPS